ncbi:S9 family peptidase [Streptomonospora sp. S1-112]|uniref:S9 family peptidase n=1 Tax=Streptomonospora mangrovi TaxID=2883123 RepID=A0A9X3NN48_9ACTN|nr:prolyl oligopeptidase family serine peptidase [Streptomonospora mangrovi]MDA0566794.1 S9 family peptidase [Streptomonospora mangrovi]
MGERWQERFRAGRVGLPSWAREAPDHSLFRSDVRGTWELYARGRATGERRQVTKRHHGTEGVVSAAAERPDGTVEYAWSSAAHPPPETEALRSFDRALSGGAPDEVPDRYRRSSPITYAAHVRAPVLVLAGENDPRCPIRQVDTYLARPAALGKEHEVYRFDAGHGSSVADERIRQTAAELDFALRVTAGEGAAAGAS